MISRVRFVVEVDLDLVKLMHALESPEQLADRLHDSIQDGDECLSDILDGAQMELLTCEVIG